MAQNVSLNVIEARRLSRNQVTTLQKYQTTSSNLVAQTSFIESTEIDVFSRFHLIYKTKEFQSNSYGYLIGIYAKQLFS